MTSIPALGSTQACSTLSEQLRPTTSFQTPDELANFIKAYLEAQEALTDGSVKDTTPLATKDISPLTYSEAELDLLKMNEADTSEHNSKTKKAAIETQAETNTLLGTIKKTAVKTGMKVIEYVYGLIQTEKPTVEIQTNEMQTQTEFAADPEIRALQEEIRDLEDDLRAANNAKSSLQALFDRRERMLNDAESLKESAYIGEDEALDKVARLKTINKRLKKENRHLKNRSLSRVIPATILATTLVITAATAGVLYYVKSDFCNEDFGSPDECVAEAFKRHLCVETNSQGVFKEATEFEFVKNVFSFGAHVVSSVVKEVATVENVKHLATSIITTLPDFSGIFKEF